MTNLASRIKRCLEQPTEPMPEWVMGGIRVFILLVCPLPGWLVLLHCWWDKEMPLLEIIRVIYCDEEFP